MKTVLIPEHGHDSESVLVVVESVALGVADAWLLHTEVEGCCIAKEEAASAGTFSGFKHDLVPNLLCCRIWCKGE